MNKKQVYMVFIISLSVILFLSDAWGSISTYYKITTQRQNKKVEVATFLEKLSEFYETAISHCNYLQNEGTRVEKVNKNHLEELTSVIRPKLRNIESKHDELLRRLDCQELPNSKLLLIEEIRTSADGLSTIRDEVDKYEHECKQSEKKIIKNNQYIKESMEIIKKHQNDVRRDLQNIRNQIHGK